MIESSSGNVKFFILSDEEAKDMNDRISSHSRIELPIGNWLNQPDIKEPTVKPLSVLNKITDVLGNLLTVLVGVALFMWFVILWL